MSAWIKPSCNGKITSPGPMLRAYFFTVEPSMTTMVWSRRGACVKARAAAAPRASPSLALTHGSAGLLQRKERLSRRRHLEDERWKRDRRVEAEAPKLYALARVDQAKLQWKNNSPWYYAASLFFPRRAIDDYPGVVAQRSVGQGSRRSYAARVPFPCHERVALARVSPSLRHWLWK